MCLTLFQLKNPFSRHYRSSCFLSTYVWVQSAPWDSCCCCFSCCFTELWKLEERSYSSSNDDQDSFIQVSRTTTSYEERRFPSEWIKAEAADFSLKLSSNECIVFLLPLPPYTGLHSKMTFQKNKTPLKNSKKTERENFDVSTSSTIFQGYILIHVCVCHGEKKQHTAGRQESLVVVAMALLDGEREREAPEIGSKAAV